MDGVERVGINASYRWGEEESEGVALSLPRACLVLASFVNESWKHLFSFSADILCTHASRDVVRRKRCKVVWPRQNRESPRERGSAPGSLNEDSRTRKLNMQLEEKNVPEDMETRAPRSPKQGFRPQLW